MKKGDVYTGMVAKYGTCPDGYSTVSNAVTDSTGSKGKLLSDAQVGGTGGYWNNALKHVLSGSIIRCVDNAFKTTSFGHYGGQKTFTRWEIVEYCKGLTEAQFNKYAGLDVQFLLISNHSKIVPTGTMKPLNRDDQKQKVANDITRVEASIKAKEKEQRELEEELGTFRQALSILFNELSQSQERLDFLNKFDTDEEEAEFRVNDMSDEEMKQFVLDNIR